MTDKIVVLCTCAALEDGERMARALLDARLAACVSVLPGVKSYYHWKGELESASECLLVIKSSGALFGELRKTIEEMHAYEIPEVLALPVVDGAPNYLEWMSANLRPGADR